MIKRRGSLVALFSVSVVSAISFFHLGKLDTNLTADVAIESLPMQLGPWQGTTAEALSTKSQEILKLTRYIKRDYRVPEKPPISLYIGYWQKQTGEYQAAKHSPVLCLPSNGWHIERKPPVDLKLEDGLEVTAKRILGEWKGRPHLFYYWFFTGEKNYSEEWRSLLNISFQRFFFGRSDGGIIEVSLPLESGVSRQTAEENADKTVQDFLFEFYPELHKLIHSAQK